MELPCPARGHQLLSILRWIQLVEQKPHFLGCTMPLPSPRQPHKANAILALSEGQFLTHAYHHQHTQHDLKVMFWLMWTQALTVTRLDCGPLGRTTGVPQLNFLTSQIRLNGPSCEAALTIVFADEDTQQILAEHPLCAARHLFPTVRQKQSGNRQLSLSSGNWPSKGF